MGLFSQQAPVVASPILRLQAGQVWTPPAGWYRYRGSLMVNLQRFDPRASMWRFTGDDPTVMRECYFDGTTMRLANVSGCVVGALVTTAGSSYTTPPTVTASAGSATLQAILGGAVSTAATIVSAGTGYLYPPLLWIEQPPFPGLQATGTTAISNGTISSVTIDGQGAGYLYPPNVLVVPDARDTVGSGGQVTVALTGAGTVTGVIVTNHGSPITSGTVPTLTFGSGSAAATAIMDWGVTTYGITTPGGGYTSAAGAVTASGAAGVVTTAGAYLSHETETNFTRWRPAALNITTNASGALSAFGSIIDPGRYQSIPTPVITAAQSPSTVGVITLTMGGVSGTAYLQPMQNV